MCNGTTAGLEPAPRRDEPTRENAGACVHCGAPADGFDATADGPACRACATGRDDARVPYDGLGVACDDCGRGLEIVAWRDGRPLAGHCRACGRTWTTWSDFSDPTGVDRDEVLLADGYGDGGIRVVCRDCGLERIWYPSDGRRKHAHERVTDHEVAYEAADERARLDRDDGIRTDGGRDVEAKAADALDEMMAHSERQTEAVERLADAVERQASASERIARCEERQTGALRDLAEQQRIETAALVELVRTIDEAAFGEEPNELREPRRHSSLAGWVADAALELTERVDLDDVDLYANDGGTDGV